MKLIVKDVPGLDGEYDADFSRFTNNEGKLIKKLSGVRMGEIRDALKAGDNDLLVACAVVFLQRAGKDSEVAEQLLGDADMGCLELDTTEEERAEAAKAEADARPPDSPTVNGSANELDSIDSSGERNGSSGVTTTPVSDDVPATGSPSGSPGLDTGSISDHVT